MTNAQIIFMESCRLLEEGVIGTTGRKLTMELPDGTTKELMEPEPIHTYQTWKSFGYQVRKGEKNIAAFTIWKARTKKAEGNDEEGGSEETRMFMKTAHFFKISQCDKIA